MYKKGIQGAQPQFMEIESVDDSGSIDISTLIERLAHATGELNGSSEDIHLQRPRAGQCSQTSHRIQSERAIVSLPLSAAIRCDAMISDPIRSHRYRIAPQCSLA